VRFQVVLLDAKAFFGRGIVSRYPSQIQMPGRGSLCLCFHALIVQIAVSWSKTTDTQSYRHAHVCASQSQLFYNVPAYLKTGIPVYTV